MAADPATPHRPARVSVRVVIVWILVAVACVAGVGLVLLMPTSSKTVGLVYGAF